MYTRTHSHTHAHTHAHTHVYIFILVCARVRACVCAFLFVCLHAFSFSQAYSLAAGLFMLRLAQATENKITELALGLDIEVTTTVFLRRASFWVCVCTSACYVMSTMGVQTDVMVNMLTSVSFAVGLASQQVCERECVCVRARRCADGFPDLQGGWGFTLTHHAQSALVHRCCATSLPA